MAITSKDVRMEQEDAKEVFEGAQDIIDSGGTIEDVADVARDAQKKANKKKVAKLTPDDKSDKILMKMERQNASWKTPEGTVFSQDHPFQLVTESESIQLRLSGGFRIADSAELVGWYSRNSIWVLKRYHS